MKVQGNWTLSDEPGVLRYEHNGGKYATEATVGGWIILQNGNPIGTTFKTSEAAKTHVEQVLLEERP